MQIGFIGLGIMGASIASNIQKAGYRLVVHDARPASAEPHRSAGAAWADTPRELAAQCDVILTSLPGPAEFEQVCLGETGLFSGLQKDTAHFDLTTNTPALIRRLGSLYQDRGAHLFDAPVSGGPKGAASGKLAIWVGGDRDVFDRHRSVLDACGESQYIGPLGSATVAKLVNNCASYAINAVLAEAFTMGVKAGVDPLVLFKALRAGGIGRQRTYDRMANQFLIDDYDPPSFALKLAQKDVILAIALAREVSVPMKVCELALADMTEAMNRGWGHLDSRVAMKLQEERAGVKVAVEADGLKAVMEGAGTSRPA